jgi:hypothetical protein
MFPFALLSIGRNALHHEVQIRKAIAFLNSPAKVWSGHSSIRKIFSPQTPVLWDMFTKKHIV